MINPTARRHDPTLTRVGYVLTRDVIRQTLGRRDTPLNEDSKPGGAQGAARQLAHCDEHATAITATALTRSGGNQ